MKPGQIITDVSRGHVKNGGLMRELPQNPLNSGLLGGGFKYFLCSSLLGEMIQFD